jgi:hypothetical protein
MRWIYSGELKGKAVEASCMHMKGAAREVATVFVSALSRAIMSSPRPIKASEPYPRPTAPGPCESDLLKAASTDVSAIRKKLESWRKDLRKLFE